MASLLNQGSSPTQNISDSIENSRRRRIKTLLYKIIREKNVCSLRKFGGPSMIAATFNSDLQSGLKTRTLEAGSLKQVESLSFMSYLLEEMKNAILFPLVISAVICFAAQLVVDNPDYGWRQGIEILFNILLLTFLPSILKYCRARSTVKKLKSQKSAVIRDGKCLDLAISEVVEGELVLLKKADIIPGDGCLLSGNGLEVDNILDPHIDCDNNPFLSSGSKVVSGEGRMIVVSTGANTSLGENMLLINRKPYEEQTLFQTQMDKLSKIKDYIIMFMYIILALAVLFQILYKRNHHKHGQGSTVPSPNLQSKVSADYVEAMFSKILLRPRGNIVALFYSLTAVVLGLLDILPPTILVSLFLWKRNLKNKYQIHAQDLYVSGTMGLATTLVVDVSKGLLVGLCREAVTALRDSGVSIRLVSPDEEEMVRAIAGELDLVATPSDLVDVVNGEDLDPDEITRNSGVLSIRIIYKSQPKHTLLLVKALRKNGHVVAYLGGLMTLDSSALKEADVGITAESHSCALARESSNIIVRGCEESLLPLLTCGRFVYSNVGSFVETLHTTSICIIFTAFILPPLYLLWPIFVIHFIGFSIIMMELPKKTTTSLKVKVMYLNIGRNVLCQVLLLLGVGFLRKPVLGLNKDIQEVMALNIFTMFQVFYLFKSMELGNLQVLKVAGRNTCFLAAVGVAMICHVAVISCAESLSSMQWAICLLLALSLWVLDSILNSFHNALNQLKNWFSDRNRISLL